MAKAPFKISLAAARVNAKLRQEDVAKSLGVSKLTIINWEKGKTTPSIANFEKLAEIYNIPMDYIFLPHKLT